MIEALSKKISLEQNLDSLSYVVDANESSKKLFDSLDFECRATIAWYIL